jgi:cytidine deaminase
MKPAQKTSMPALSRATLNDLIARATAASKNAYCKYSKFPVGAAVLTNKGKVYTGCNVENASYGLTMCAERNAIFQMVAQARQKIVAVVIYTAGKEPAAPCGACRQVINEFGPAAQVISVCKSRKRIATTLDKLLPSAFGPANLPAKRTKAP